MNLFAATTALAIALTPIGVLAQTTSSAPETTTSAGTQRTTSDVVVRLRNRSLVRGRIVSRNADGSLILEMPTGESRALAGADIDAIVGLEALSFSSSTAVTALPPVPMQIVRPPAIAPEAPDSDDIATLRRSRSRVALEVESTADPMDVGISGGTYTSTFGRTTITTDVRDAMCRTPCTLWVRPGAFPLWAGGELITSTHATVDVPSGGLRVRVRHGSQTARGLGNALTWFSAIALVGGAVVTPIMFSARAPTGALVGGFVAIAVGAIGLPFGIAIQVIHGGGIASSEPLSAAGPDTRHAHLAGAVFQSSVRF